MTKQTSEHHSVIIVGAGFAGLCMAIKLKQAGRNDFILIEKEAGVGGTWRVNTYPGCACDVPSHLYSYSFFANPNWSQRLAPQKEIKAYLERCAEHFQLLTHIKFNCSIKRLHWCEESRHWRILCEDGGYLTAGVVVMAAGGLSTPAYPNISGLDNFKGKVFHSQNWDHDYDLAGKRVAVIGTGASAIQFIPHVQKKAAQLDVYQRSAPWILPRVKGEYSEEEKGRFRRFPFYRKWIRAWLYLILEARVLSFTKMPFLLRLMQKWALTHLLMQVSSLELQSKLTPDYVIGCKRILMSNTYYPALQKEDVDVITSPIKCIHKDAIEPEEGKKRSVDAIILGTGFKVSQLIEKHFIYGRGGRDIADCWKHGPEAYKGAVVSGFPNLFILLGPNTGLGHNSVIYMIESQVAYVMSALRYMEKHSISVVDVHSDTQEDYNARLQTKLKNTVWNNGGCKSWYMHPESGKNVALWPGFSWLFRLQTRRFDARAYQMENKDIHSNSNGKEVIV